MTGRRLILGRYQPIPGLTPAGVARMLKRRESGPGEVVGAFARDAAMLPGGAG